MLEQDALHWVLTRPSHQVPAWQQYLCKARVPHFVFPTVEIRPYFDIVTTDILSAVAAADLIVITSANSIFCAEESLIGLLQRHPEKIYCLGEGTAASLRQHQIEPHFIGAEGFTSERLLTQPCFSTENIAGKSVVVLSGVGGREILADTLKQRSARLTKIPLYQRATPVYSRDALQSDFQAFRQHEIVWMITSSSAIDGLHRLTPASFQTWMLQQRMVVVSERILSYAIRCGHIRVLNADTTDIAAIHRFVQSLLI